MKLLYQWLIVLSLSVLLWIVYSYGGTICTKPVIQGGSIPKLIIVQQRQSSIESTKKEEIKEDSVPKVEVTPPRRQQVNEEKKEERT